LEGYDGAKWLHASTEVEFDNSDDESCAIHNLLANLIWARKHEIAETVAVEDIGYLWYRELRQVEDPVPYLDIDLPSSYSGTTLRFSWPLAVDSDLASICAVAKTFGKVVEEIERSQKLIFEGIEIIKTPLVQYNNYSFV
jgi:hypothetical protein